MAQEVTTIQIQPPAVASAEVRDLFLALRNDLLMEAGRYTLTRLPTKEERKALQARVIELDTALREVSYSTETRRRGGAALAVMFGSYDKARSMKDDNKGTEKRKLITSYISQLWSYPVFAVEMACDDVMQNRVADLSPDFIPSIPRIVQLTRGHSIEPRAEHAEIKRLLAVTDVRFDAAANPEAVERIRKGFEDLALEISTNDARREAERQKELSQKSIDRNRQQVLRMYAAQGIEPQYTSSGVLISPTLLAKNRGLVGRGQVRPEYEGEGS